MKTKNNKMKLFVLGNMMMMGLLIPSENAYSNDLLDTAQEATVTVRATENEYLRITLATTNEIIFTDVSETTIHGTWINPQTPSSFNVSVDSSRPFTLALEGDDFVNVEDEDTTIPLSHLRTRVTRVTLPNGSASNTTSSTGGSGTASTNLGATNAWHTLSSDTRSNLVTTNRVGENFIYQTGFNFLANRDISEGDYRATIRYVAWQR